MSSQMALLDAPVHTRERVRAALLDGGRARVTVTSKSSGKHLTIRLACKTKGMDDRFISRARIIGRVGYEDAVAVFCDADDTAVEGWVGTLWRQDDHWVAPRQFDDPRTPHYVWAARRVLRWAIHGDPEFDEMAEVELISECSHCGRSLRDPESIARGIGPECFGRSTHSEHA